jgi:tRNA(fMet)-specific endonuclease VapC
MSLFVLDPDTLTLSQHSHPVVLGRVSAYPPDEIAITVLSVEEQLSGWYTRIRQAKRPDALALAYRRLAECVTSLSGLRILSFTEPAITRYDALKRLQLGIGKMDLRIAAVTLEEGGILVTRNVRDFQRVPGLTIEDWST